ncbi:MAG: hypothetical protein GY726_10555 [Proteobacteria bacterium]|nr:hypothetical protein [Pseudomonadota bacterium]
MNNLIRLGLFVLTIVSFGAKADRQVVVIPMGAGVEQKTIQLAIPPSGFVTTNPQANVPYYNSGDWVGLTSTIIGLAAPVQLPEGANLTGMSCYVLDDNASADFTIANTQYSLWRRDVLAVDPEEAISWVNMGTTGASSTIQEFSTNTIIHPTIDNSQHFYSIYILLERSASDPAPFGLRFYGCMITYTAEVVVP